MPSLSITERLFLRRQRIATPARRKQSPPDAAPLPATLSLRRSEDIRDTRKEMYNMDSNLQGKNGSKM